MSSKEERMSVTQTQQPDLAAVKGRQRHAWASGDYSAVAARIVPMAEKLVEPADLQAGQRVLDVACGNGNAAPGAGGGRGPGGRVRRG
jgi:cyclopropane fatty-acyl-phospholipid synthase-like methyltransferase